MLNCAPKSCLILNVFQFNKNLVYIPGGKDSQIIAIINESKSFSTFFLANGISLLITNVLLYRLGDKDSNSTKFYLYKFWYTIVYGDVDLSFLLF